MPPSPQTLSEAADQSEALRGTSVLDRAATTEVALFHQFAGYKRTAKY